MWHKFATILDCLKSIFPFYHSEALQSRGFWYTPEEDGIFRQITSGQRWSWQWTSRANVGVCRPSNVVHLLYAHIWPRRPLQPQFQGWAHSPLQGRAPPPAVRALWHPPGPGGGHRLHTRPQVPQRAWDLWSTDNCQARQRRTGIRGTWTGPQGAISCWSGQGLHEDSSRCCTC